MCIFVETRPIPEDCNSQYILSGFKIAVHNDSCVTHESRPFHGIISYGKNFIRFLEQETYSYTTFVAIKMHILHAILHVPIKILAMCVSACCKYQILIKKIKYNFKFSRHALHDSCIR